MIKGGIIEKINTSINPFKSIVNKNIFVNPGIISKKNKPKITAETFKKE